MSKALQPAEWTVDALCARVGGDWWFASKGDNEAVRQAKAICRRCPVIGPCLQEALDRDEIVGVWGGTSPSERRKLKRAAA